MVQSGLFTVVQTGESLLPVGIEIDAFPTSSLSFMNLVVFPTFDVAIHETNIDFAIVRHEVSAGSSAAGGETGVSHGCRVLIEQQQLLCRPGNHAGFDTSRSGVLTPKQVFIAVDF